MAVGGSRSGERSYDKRGRGGVGELDYYAV